MTRCNWYDGSHELQCSREGEHVLIYGCLEQHIGEIVFCKDHLLTWDGMAVDDRAWCPRDNCGNYVAEWTVVGIRNVTVGWLRRYVPQ
jgi:hypothetical protein